jgi:hypothetical protein
MARKEKRSKTSKLKDVFVNDFDDYGLDVKNTRRIKKKKVSKFKNYDDSYYHQDNYTYGY